MFTIDGILNNDLGKVIKTFLPQIANAYGQVEPPADLRPEELYDCFERNLQLSLLGEKLNALLRSMEDLSELKSEGLYYRDAFYELLTELSSSLKQTATELYKQGLLRLTESETFEVICIALNRALSGLYAQSRQSDVDDALRQKVQKLAADFQQLPRSADAREVGIAFLVQVDGWDFPEDVSGVEVQQLLLFALLDRYVGVSFDD